MSFEILFLICFDKQTKAFSHPPFLCIINHSAISYRFNRLKVFQICILTLKLSISVFSDICLMTPTVNRFVQYCCVIVFNSCSLYDNPEFLSDVVNHLISIWPGKQHDTLFNYNLKFPQKCIFNFTNQLLLYLNMSFSRSLHYNTTKNDRKKFYWIQYVTFITDMKLAFSIKSKPFDSINNQTCSGCYSTLTIIIIIITIQYQLQTCVYVVFLHNIIR